MKQKILLETTIQLHRIADDYAIKKNINSECQGKEVYTTTFVLREFLRTIIKDVAYIRSAVNSVAGEPDGRIVLGQLVRALAHGSFNYSSRAARREQYVIGAILDAFEGRPLPREKLLTFLEMTAQQWILDFFEVPDETGSFRRIRDVHFLSGMDDPPDEMLQWIARRDFPIPGPAPFPMGAARLLNSRLDVLREVVRLFQAAPSKRRDTKLLTFLARFRKRDGEFDFANLGPRTRGNWCLGDLLIALETPQGVSIYTTDNHFDVICEALSLHRHKGFQPLTGVSVSEPKA